MMRGEWFLGLALFGTALLLLRLALGRPLLASWARPISIPDAWAIVVALTLLVFHCTAMFAPEIVAGFPGFDRPAAVVRDLRDPLGQAAYWIPAVVLILGTRRSWWPAPASLTFGLLAVGWTMYGDFTVTQHVVTIVATGGLIAVVLTGLVLQPTRNFSESAG
jgi:hypothetical protein